MDPSSNKRKRTTIQQPDWSQLEAPKGPIFTSGNQCPVCLTNIEDTASLKLSPSTCKVPHHQHANRACKQCWEAYLSLAVEERPLDEISCMFCPSLMPEKEIKKFCRDKTAERIDGLVERATKQTCQARCSGSVEKDLSGAPLLCGDGDNVHFEFVQQDHDLEKDGRVFRCRFCAFATCVVCDRPEHIGEDCTAYQTRTKLHAALPPAHPLDPTAQVTMKSAIKNCPSCEMYWSLVEEGGCGYVKCHACQYRFCQRCLIPWVGDESEYLAGPRGHGVETATEVRCKYATRLYPSGHGLMDRYYHEPGVERSSSKRAMRMKG